MFTMKPSKKVNSKPARQSESAVEPSMNQARTVSISIGVSPRKSYDFISDPKNLPRWSLFVRTVKKAGKVWRVETQAGASQMRFVARNKFGVVDHWVRPSSDGPEIYVPLRVIPNQKGCEVLFTVFRLPSMDAAAYKKDIAMVQKDLAHLKSVLEAA